MTLRDLIEQFRFDTDDVSTPPLVTDKELTVLLNEAEREAATRAHLLFDRSSAFATLSLKAGIREIRVNPIAVDVAMIWLIDSGGERHKVTATDRDEQDRINPDWRTNTELPTGFMFYDSGVVEFNAAADADYTAKLETHRLPKSAMAQKTDSPEIGAIHHPYLVEWAKYKTYAKPDSDLFDANKAKEALAKFEDYFGFRPDADARKRERANQPHRNKAYW